MRTSTPVSGAPLTSSVIRTSVVPRQTLPNSARCVSPLRTVTECVPLAGALWRQPGLSVSATVYVPGIRPSNA